jgi:hypothetical protein
MHRAYIADNTRVPVPPDYFVQRLADYDSDLRLLPSRHTPHAYVIARVMRFSSWSKAQVDATTQPDTLLCMAHGLIPVCLMYQFGDRWNADTVLVKLKSRDLWAHGGADKVADMLEAQEADEKTKRDKTVRDEIWDRSGDAWRSYQARTGQRVINSGPSQPGAATKGSSSRTATGSVTLTD